MSGQEHVFKFSRNWRDGKRLCGECGEKYLDGGHTEIHPLKPYTSYICPTGRIRGHSSKWSGDQGCPELRSPRDRFCLCGAELVEEDAELWRLTFEMQSPLRPEWHEVAVVRSRYAAHNQRDGLLELIERGEPIRRVKLVQLQATPS